MAKRAKKAKKRMKKPAKKIVKKQKVKIPIKTKAMVKAESTQTALTVIIQDKIWKELTDSDIDAAAKILGNRSDIPSILKKIETHISKLQKALGQTSSKEEVIAKVEKSEKIDVPVSVVVSGSLPKQDLVNFPIPGEIEISTSNALSKLSEPELQKFLNRLGPNIVLKLKQLQLL